jgi:hypothetical protein
LLCRSDVVALMVFVQVVSLSSSLPVPA